MDSSIKPGFPICEAPDHAPTTVPRGFIKQFEARIRRNHDGLSLDDLESRGGLTAYEIYAAALSQPLDDPGITYLALGRNKYEVARKLKFLVEAWESHGINVRFDRNGRY